jgi:hypothetical protein
VGLTDEVQLGYRRKRIPAKCTVPEGAKIRICPLSNRMEARERFPVLRLQDYNQEDEDLAKFRSGWIFWKVQIHRMLQIQDPGEVTNSEFFLRKGLSKVQPGNSREFALCLAGVFGALCSKYGVDRRTTSQVSEDAVADWELESSLDEEKAADLPPSMQDQARAMLLRAKWNSLRSPPLHRPIDSVDSEEEGARSEESFKSSREWLAKGQRRSSSLRGSPSAERLRDVIEEEPSVELQERDADGGTWQPAAGSADRPIFVPRPRDRADKDVATASAAGMQAFLDDDDDILGLKPAAAPVRRQGPKKRQEGSRQEPIPPPATCCGCGKVATEACPLHALCGHHVCGDVNCTLTPAVGPLAGLEQCACGVHDDPDVEDAPAAAVGGIHEGPCSRCNRLLGGPMSGGLPPHQCMYLSDRSGQVFRGCMDYFCLACLENP